MLCAVFHISCGGEKTSMNQQQESISVQAEMDSVKAPEESQEEKQRKRLKRQRQDSLWLEGVLLDVLNDYTPESYRTTFSDSLKLFPDSLCRVNVKIDFGSLLSRRQKHLIVHLVSPMGNRIDLFSFKNGKPVNILRYDMHSLAYHGDTLQDVNGDGLNDLVLNGYSQNGCCLKAFSEVFLTKKDLQSFSPKFHFINPTFSGRERVIRGVCYGHLGETELYKFKWRNYEVDTVEYIAFERTETGERTGKVIASNYYPEHKNYRILRTVPAVPKEYLTIEGFDWFANEFVKK